MSIFFVLTANRRPNEFNDGDMFADWRGHAMIAGLSSEALVRVVLDGDSASEAARYAIDGRARSLDIAPDGSIWVATDGGEIYRVSK